MAHTIETFVSKLQEEGVQAGQQAAEKLRADAQAEADKIIADAKAQAEKIIADAETEAQGKIDRAQTEMQLAARDTVAKLRDTLEHCLAALFSEATAEKLQDTDFVGKALYEIVTMYAKSEKDQKAVVHINVPDEMRTQLKEWALATLGSETVDKARPRFELKGKLKQVGFEYEVHGGTVEVTTASVTQLLSDMVTPALQELLQSASQSESKDN
jgi:V/A-type H+/Na+-transporting ATPase subunit E